MSDVSDTSSYEIIATDEEGGLNESLSTSSTSKCLPKPLIQNDEAPSLIDSSESHKRHEERINEGSDKTTDQSMSIDAHNLESIFVDCEDCDNSTADIINMIKHAEELLEETDYPMKTSSLQNIPIELELKETEAKLNDKVKKKGKRLCMLLKRDKKLASAYQSHFDYDFVQTLVPADNEVNIIADNFHDQEELAVRDKQADAYETNLRNGDVLESREESDNFTFNNECGDYYDSGSLILSENSGNNGSYIILENHKIENTQKKLSTSLVDNSARTAFTDDSSHDAEQHSSAPNLSTYENTFNNQENDESNNAHKVMSFVDYSANIDFVIDSNTSLHHKTCAKRPPNSEISYDICENCYHVLSKSRNAQDKTWPVGNPPKANFTSGVVTRLLDATCAKYPLGSTSDLNDVGSIATQTENISFRDNSQSHYTVHVDDTGPKKHQGHNCNLCLAPLWCALPNSRAGIGLRTSRVSYGFFDWLRKSQSVQGILRKARNSFNNILIVLDPEMEHTIEPDDELIISLVTNDESETTAIRKAFQKVFMDSTYVTLTSLDDNVPDLPSQPIGFLSGLSCAEKKINFLKQRPDSDEIIIAISPLLVEATTLRWHGCHCILLDDPTRDLSLHVYTQMTPVPNDYVYQSEIRTPSSYPLRDLGLSCTLGQTLATLTGAPRSNWTKTLSGVSYYKTLENAAETLAGMYQCYVNAWME